MKRYDIVDFWQPDWRRKVYPMQPLPRCFIVSDKLFHLDGVEVSPLTVTGFVRAVCVNFMMMNRHRFVWWAYKRGFLDPAEGAIVSFREDWRWNCSEVLRERRKAEQTRQAGTGAGPV